MSVRFGRFRAIFARIVRALKPQSTARLEVPANPAEFRRACKELAFWSVSDAGLSGPIEAFDGVVLHPAADGMFTLRMTLQDTVGQRSPGDAANIIVRSLEGLRVLLLLDIDGQRFSYAAPHVNAGVRALCRTYTNRTESTG